MHVTIHGTLWLACVLLSGDLRAQDTPSDQSVSPPSSVPESPTARSKSLPSTNQGSKASRVNSRTRDATSQSIAQASLTSVITVSGMHWHQATLFCEQPVPLTLPADAVNVTELHDPSRSTTITYESVSMDPPQFPEGIVVGQSTREIYGPRHVQLLSEHHVPRIPLEPPSEVILQISRESAWGYHMHLVPKKTFSFEDELAMVTGNEVLETVADAFYLPTIWRISRAKAVERLRASLTFTNPRNLDLIYLQSSHGAEIANAISETYRAHRNDLGEKRQQLAMADLDTALRTQADKVEECRLRMLDLAETLPFHPPSFRAGFQSYFLPSITETLQRQLAVLRRNSLVEAAAHLCIEDPTFQQLWPLYQHNQLRHEELLTNGLGAQHPKVIANQRQLSMINDILTASLESTKLRIAEKLQLAEQERQLEINTPFRSSDDRHKLAAYQEASADYENQQALLAKKQSTYAADQLGISLAHTPINVHQEAPQPSARSFHKLSQTQSGSWPSFDYNLVDLEHPRRRFWTYAASCTLCALVIGFFLLKSRLSHTSSS